MLLHFLDHIKKLGRREKQFLMIAGDVLLLPCALWLSLSLRLSNIWPVLYWMEYWWIMVMLPFFSIPLFIHCGLYRAVLKYMGYQVIVATVKAITIASLTLGTILTFLNTVYFPKSTIIIFWFVSILIIVSSRYIMKSILYLREPVKMPIALYGAGEAGSQVLDNLRSSSEYIPVALFDDDPVKWGTFVNSMWVNSSDEMGDIIKKKDIKLILLSIIGISHEKRREILKNISQFPVQVRMIVGIDNLISGDFDLNHIQSVDVKDILGRDPVMPNIDLLQKNILRKNVLVTGAGGSIGKELCKQIINLNPKKVILYENNEYALYKANMELKDILPYVEIFPILASTLDSIKFKEILQNYQINTIYHAAAYKHVPLVEMNPLEGIKNNIIGTYNCVVAAMETNVDTFILISTDKAVRPSNVMGATKRFSELLLQGANKLSSNTNYSMVRFGNVLDSAGSVVPLFRDQINKGGPVTVTHPNVTRYFMSIPEAVELVIQAGAMARGGDVFVLEMGEPIKIIDLAEKMIHLSGFELKNNEIPSGDIEIKITGLRPGEKLNEELIIGNNVYSTDHPQILKAEENYMIWSEVENATLSIKSCCESLDVDEALKVLKKCVDDWKPSSHSSEYIKAKVNVNIDSNSDRAEC